MKKILISIALISIGAITKAQNLGEASIHTMVGSTIRFSTISANQVEGFFAITPDTLWIRQRRNPQLGRDFLLVEAYKGLEYIRATPGERRVNHSTGVVATSTPTRYIAGRDFLVVSHSINSERSASRAITTIRNIKLQDIITGEQFIWSIRDGRTPRTNISAIQSVKGFSFVNVGDALTEFENRRVQESQRQELARETERQQREIEAQRREIEAQRRNFERRQTDGRLNLTLTSVERPANPQIRHGRTVVEETEEASVLFRYTDNFIDISWLPTPFDFMFVLTNNSPHSMRVIWDEAVFVNENGGSSRMVQGGIRLIEINNPQTPAVVPRGATLTNSLTPVRNIGRDGRRPLFDRSDRERLENRTVRILLPLQIQNVTNEYTFTFRINWQYTHPELRNMTFEEYMQRQQ